MRIGWLGILAAMVVFLAVQVSAATPAIRVTNCGWHEAPGPYVCGHTSTYSCTVQTTYPEEARVVYFQIYNGSSNLITSARKATLTSGTRTNGVWSWSVNLPKGGGQLRVDSVSVIGSENPTQICENYVPWKKDGSDPNNPCLMQWSEVKPYTGNLDQWMLDNYQVIQPCSWDNEIVQCQWSKTETCSGDLQQTCWRPNSQAACGKNSYCDPAVYKDCCTPNWQASGVTGCQINWASNPFSPEGKILRNFLDVNRCYEKTGLSSDNVQPVGSGFTQSCTIDGWVNQGGNRGGSGRTTKSPMGSRAAETIYDSTSFNSMETDGLNEPLAFDLDKDGSTELVGLKGIVDVKNNQILTFPDSMIHGVAIGGMDVYEDGETYLSTMISNIRGPSIVGFRDATHFTKYYLLNNNNAKSIVEWNPEFTADSSVFSGPSCFGSHCYFIDAGNKLYGVEWRNNSLPVYSLDLSSSITSYPNRMNQVPIFVDVDGGGAVPEDASDVVVLSKNNAGLVQLTSCSIYLASLSRCGNYVFSDSNVVGLTDMSNPISLGRGTNGALVAMVLKYKVNAEYQDQVWVFNIASGSPAPTITLVSRTSIVLPNGATGGIVSRPVASRCASDGSMGVAVAKTYTLSGDSNAYVLYNCYALKGSPQYLNLVGQFKDTISNNGVLSMFGPYALASAKVNYQLYDSVISAYGVYDLVKQAKIMSLSGKKAYPGESVAAVDVNSDNILDVIMSRQNAVVLYQTSGDPPDKTGQDKPPEPIPCNQRPDDPVCKDGPCDPTLDPTCVQDPCPGCQPCVDCAPKPGPSPTFTGLDCYYNRDLKRLEVYVINPVSPHPDSQVFLGKLKVSTGNYDTKTSTQNPVIFSATSPGVYTASITMKDEQYDPKFETAAKSCSVEVSANESKYSSREGCTLNPDGEFNYFRPTSQFNWELGNGLWLISSDTSRTFSAVEPDMSSGSYAKFLSPGNQRIVSILHPLSCSRARVDFETFMSISPETEGAYWFEYQVYGEDSYGKVLPVADFRVRNSAPGEPDDRNVFVYDVENGKVVPVGQVPVGEFHKITLGVRLASPGVDKEQFTVSIDGVPVPQVFSARNSGIKKLVFVGMASTAGNFYVDYTRMTSSDSFTSMEDLGKMAERYAKSALTACYERGEVRDPVISVGIGQNVSAQTTKTFGAGTVDVYPHIGDYCTRLYNVGMNGVDEPWCNMEWLKEAVTYNPKCYWEAMNYCVGVTYPLSQGFEKSDTDIYTNNVADRSAGITACSAMLMANAGTTKILGAVVAGSIAGFSGNDTLMVMAILASIIIGVMIYSKWRNR